jgi:hypothetical protein
MKMYEIYGESMESMGWSRSRLPGRCVGTGVGTGHVGAGCCAEWSGTWGLGGGGKNLRILDVFLDVSLIKDSDGFF